MTKKICWALWTIILGVVLAGCSEASGDSGSSDVPLGVNPNLNGTWLHTDLRGNLTKLENSDGNFVQSLNGVLGYKGTYITYGGFYGGAISRTITHTHGDMYRVEYIGLPDIASKWYTANELKAALIAGGMELEDASSYDVLYGELIWEYSLTDSTLTLSGYNTTTTYTKQ